MTNPTTFWFCCFLCMVFAWYMERKLRKRATEFYNKASVDAQYWMTLYHNLKGSVVRTTKVKSIDESNSRLYICDLCNTTFAYPCNNYMVRANCPHCDKVHEIYTTD